MKQADYIERHRRYWDDLADRNQRTTWITTDDFHFGPQIPG